MSTTSIRATETRTFSDADSWGHVLSRHLGNYSTLAARPWSELSQIEFLPGVPVGAENYVVPEEWLPHGGMRRLSSRQIDMSLPGVGAAEAIAARRQNIRRTVMALSLPRQTQTGIRRYKPTSWLGHSRTVMRMARWSVDQVPAANGTLWSHLSSQHWHDMREALVSGERSVWNFDLVVRQLRDLGARGVIADFPAHDPASLPTGALSSIEVSPRERSSAERRPTPKPERSFQPFSDEFVTQIITRATWLHENLADQLLECWAELREANQRAATMGRRASTPQTTQERRAIIAAFDWRDATGAPLTRLPWKVSVTESQRTIQTDQWPPKDPAAINMMIGILQALNFCVLNFCAGARSSEILAADRHSLDLEKGRFVSRTFKVVDKIEGQVRDWPLHPAAQRALDVQMRLAEVIRPEQAPHVWVLLRGGAEPAGSPLRNINEPVVQAVKCLDLAHLTGADRAHSHRWRHTVGRLVALSVVEAPQVLMDLFGHRDLEMTLRYMLSNPEIAQDTLRVAEEVAHAIAETAIAEVDAGLAGGPAATSLEDGLETFKMRRGEEELGAESMKEAIEILTFNGRHWHLVRPGVLCTKTVGQFGPCTQGRGTPDPGACRSDCNHRLETSRAKQQCEEALAVLLQEYAAAEQRVETMLMANLEGQILANLKRWDDVRERVLQASPAARRIWSSAQETVAG